MDWTATILSIAKTRAHPDFPLDGINLLPVLTGKKKEIQRTLYWRTTQRKKSEAIREGNWKYLQDETGMYLFNLSADPGEKTDLKAEQEAIFKRLKEKFLAWQKAMLQPIPL
jgi:arylsulfatase A-like enzyme